MASAQPSTIGFAALQHRGLREPLLSRSIVPLFSTPTRELDAVRQAI
jgi:hypothetical protein